MLSSPELILLRVQSAQWLCVERQAAAVYVLLRLFRFSILAFEVGERHAY